jgi:putative redox protein
MTGKTRGTQRAPNDYLQRILTARVYDVVLILKRGRHAVTGCRVKLSAERAASDPKVFTRINMHFIVSGRQLKGDAVARAVALTHEKYCSATAMLAKTAEISVSHEVIEA